MSKASRTFSNAPAALSVLALCAGLALAPATLAQDDNTPPQATPEEVGILVQAYPYSSLRLVYDKVHPEVPLIESMADLSVSIDTSSETLDAAPNATGVTLGQVLSLKDRRISVSAINEISRTVVAELNRQGIVGVLVAPDPFQINPNTAVDLREAPGILNLKIYVGVVTSVRTVGTGDRFNEEQVVDHPAHRRISLLSPAKPYTEGDRGKRKDLIRSDVLNAYVHRLNRHPSRRVDLAVAAATDEQETPNAVTLDYLVRESKPWLAYAQLSNTGTDATNEWRERFGFVHNQVTNRDDVFQADFVTSSFDNSYAALVSYEAPIPGTDLIRVKLFGDWSDYTAEDIGLPGQDIDGTATTFGGEIITSVYQKESYFVDAFVGVKHENEDVSNDVAGSSGDTDFVIGTVGLRSEQRLPTRFLFSEVAIDHTLDGGAPGEIPGLGRLRAEDEWTLFRWNLSTSFFLEPLLDPDGWKEEGTFGSRLANELAFGFNGQYSFGDRLIPQQQQVVGGLYSVRGYPQSVAAGDTVIVATAEYRIHIPQLLGTSAEPGQLFGEPFRYKPDRAYGYADWDLVLAGFVDYGQTYIEDADSTENEESLLGAGIGLGFEYRRYLRVRADWGVALEDTDNGEVESGDSEFHFVATLAF
ncbi:MAG: ShlB/FhaC/HecB family hemolysin secretion/activation protein [Phycisphaera sp.]|nr:MAG: ShlB/FhaC/HecB family hemolysin secretion/activation protein [Phycisphaera sp.]